MILLMPYIGTIIRVKAVRRHLEERRCHRNARTSQPLPSIIPDEGQLHLHRSLCPKYRRKSHHIRFLSRFWSGETEVPREHRGSFCSPVPSVWHRGREGEERGRGGRRMRTRPVQAWGGGRQRVKKKNQREAGWGVGLWGYACVQRGERKLQANVCGSVCARVCYRSVRFFVWVQSGKKQRE